VNAKDGYSEVVTDQLMVSSNDVAKL